MWPETERIPIYTCARAHTHTHTHTHAHDLHYNGPTTYLLTLSSLHFVDCIIFQSVSNILASHLSYLCGQILGIQYYAVQYKAIPCSASKITTKLHQITP